MVPERLYAQLKEVEPLADSGSTAGAGPEADAGGAPPERLLLSPAVALFRSHLPEGAGVVAGQEIGTLVILERVVTLLAPAGAEGTVIALMLEPGLHPVEYGQELFRIGRAAEEAAGGEDAHQAGSREITARQIAVRSPTNGVFYRRPDPQSPAYVSAGDTIETGHILGLVEVMKCFNQVRYGGDGCPARARVLEIGAEDGAEIQFGQLLFLLEPAG